MNGINKMDLIKYGWDSNFEKEFGRFKSHGHIPARIAQENKTNYLVLADAGELAAEVSGKFRFNADSRGKLPAVGDWAAVSVTTGENRAIIHGLLPRRSAFVRKTAGMETVEQVLAANIDTVFIICGLDDDYNVRRIERYLTLAWESGAVPIIALNKADLRNEINSCISEVEAIAIGVAVLAVSARDGTGIDILRKQIAPGKTAAFLGSSGVGKSSIINRLLGEELLPTNEVRESDSRGRHTTARRELIALPGGGMVIDTPGMRELQLWGDERGLRQAFDDIEEVASGCRFRDCGHEREPGCAIKAAIESGALSEERFASYLKLKGELRYVAARQAMKANALEKLKWKQVAMFQKKMKKKE